MVKKTKETIQAIPDPILDNSTQSPQAGSPTTGNSGLVSTTKKTKGKTPRQIAEQTQAKPERKPQIKTQIKKEIIGELGISQKRRLAYTTARHILKIEQPLNQVLKLLLDNNTISNNNPLLRYNVNVNTQQSNAISYNVDLLIRIKEPTIETSNITKKLYSLKLFTTIDVMEPINNELKIHLRGYTHTQTPQPKK